MREFLAITKALSDESRVRALMLLERGELCVCQIIEMLKLAPSTVSKHMSILYQARLVQSRKEGRWIYYRLAENESSPHVKEALAWARNCLKKDFQVIQDRKQLKTITKCDKEELCNHYK